MKHTKSALNGQFGLCLHNVTRGDLEDRGFQTEAHELWVSHGGLLVLRGKDLAELSPAALVAWSNVFGTVDTAKLANRKH